MKEMNEELESRWEKLKNQSSSSIAKMEEENYEFKSLIDRKNK